MTFELIELWGVFGVIFGFSGGILLIRFSKNPFERHVEEWIKIQKVRFPKNYEERIQRNYNYWRIGSKLETSDPTEVWLVPEKFAGYWRTMRITSYYLIIASAILFIIQMYVN